MEDMRNVPERPVDKLFPSRRLNMSEGVCTTCGNVVGEFRDELSRKEHRISGMCQDCQDSIFGE